MPPTAAKRKSLSDDEITTPTGSPPKRLRITRKQKQALVDNLQLEITERARKLRAQYALQANDLRARIERRVNRVPVALRHADVGELLEKHKAEETQKQQRKNASRKPAQPAKAGRSVTANADPKTHHPSPTAKSRRTKKQSHEGVYSDKENAPAGEPADGLKNPKRRANGAAGGTGTSRVVSQKVQGADSRILSPKSLNSKTYPHSPLRGSPDKLSHPASPLKPSSPLRGAPANLADNPRARTTQGASSAKDNRPPSQLKGATSRVGNTGTRPVRSPISRPATRQNERRLSTSTNSSTTSSGTTVVKPTRPATATGVRQPASTSTAAKKTTVARNQGAVPAKKGATSATKATPDAPGRRALRKRA
ncbi:hypothetical protein PHISP_05960 [Aspergillus sp. HF37]|nr:hypothetical protein PHISP_05960 [Aspergillus sp. HF37]